MMTSNTLSARYNLLAEAVGRFLVLGRLGRSRKTVILNLV